MTIIEKVGATTRGTGIAKITNTAMDMMGTVITAMGMITTSQLRYPKHELQV